MRYPRQFQSKILKLFDVTDRPLLSSADVGFSIFQRSEILIGSIFDAYGIKDPTVRDDRVDKLFREIESFVILPKEDWDYELKLVQGTAIKDQLNRHFEMALRQAVYVAYVWIKRLTSLMTSPFPHSEEHIREQKSRLIAEMVTAMEHCSRHLTAFWLLKNLQDRHYDGRASKGGHSRPRPPAQKAQDQLLRAMITGMLYNQPDGLKRARKSRDCVAHEFAGRIFKANQEYQMLDIADRDSLQADVLSLLVERLNASGGRSGFQSGTRLMARQLRANLVQCRSRETEAMEAEAARVQGQLEGVRTVLVQQLDARFGELPEAVLDHLYHIKTLDEYQLYLERLPQASTLDDVIAEAL